MSAKQLGTLLLLWSAFAASVARADELADFEHARRAYDAQDFPLAITRFEGLVGTEPPTLQSRPLVLESRKYLAASYLLMGRAPDAEVQFERLLRDDPRYELDPLAFPAEVLDVFARIRTRLARTIAEAAEARRRAEEEQRARVAAELAERRRRFGEIRTLARTESVEQVSDRFMAFVPFGVGQFQNDNDGLGIALATTEGVLLAYAVLSAAWHGLLPTVGSVAAEDVVRANNLETFLRVSNWISLGLFTTVALLGIVEANFSFRERRTIRRERPLPPDLENFQVRVAPGGVSMSIRF